MAVPGRRSATDARRRRLDAVELALAAMAAATRCRPERHQVEVLAALAQRFPENPSVTRALGHAIASPCWLGRVEVDDLVELERLLAADLAAES